MQNDEDIMMLSLRYVRAADSPVVKDGIRSTRRGMGGL